jgi:bacterioferritin
MKHAEIIAERLFYLGEKPTVNPSKVIVGETLKEMFEQNIKDEEKTISLYKQIIQKAKDEGDLSTAHIFNRILLEEEEHHDFFISIVEDL